MGRKIPARKHKGVKDPEKQQAARFLRIKDKINQPPTNSDEQAVPKRLLELKRLIDKTKAGKPKKRPRTLHKDSELIDTSRFHQPEVMLPGMRRPEKPVPVFKQLPGEEGHQFVHRIMLKCQEVIHECAFEDQFNVNVKRNTETGDVEEVTKVPKGDVEYFKHLNPRKPTEQRARSARNRDKRKQKKLDKAAAKQEQHVDAFAQYKDEVKFGEVVHGPPQLPCLPKKASTANDSKPGRRNLLLKELLPSAAAAQRPSLFAQARAMKKTKSKKKKTIGMAEERRREAQRVEAVQAYRMIKAKQAKINKGGP